MNHFRDLPTSRQIGLLLGCCTLFLVLAWGSRFDIIASTVACAALLAGVALALPELGILMVVFCTPIRSVFDLPQESMQIVLGSGMAAVTLRHLPLFANLLRERRPRLLLVLAAFIVVYAARGALELVQYPDTGLRTVAAEGVFFVALLGVALAAHARAAGRGFGSALLAAAAAAIVLTMAVDTIDTYFPSLGNALSLLKGIPGQRFSGLHVNPNATGKFLLLGSLLAAALVVATTRRSVALPGMLAIAATALCFSATSSKSTLLAAAGALLAWLAVAAWRLEGLRAVKILGTAALVAGAIGGWYVVIAPHAERLAMDNFLVFKNVGANAIDRPAPPTTLAQQLEDEMRIGRSYSMKVQKPPANAPANSEMYRNIPGRITYTPRNCGWACTGQRDVLWGTGVAIVAEHWLIGIGPHRWAPEYQARVGFPFDTPHNVLLELVGGYGLAGLALYLAALVLLVRLVARAFALPRAAPDHILVTATALYIVAMLLAELVDPAKFLAMTPHAIWLWIFAAASAGRLERA
jgi:hypothetical protein